MAIAIHTCKSPQQDTYHGTGHRVVNPMNKSKNQGVIQRYKCTVCGGEVDKSAVLKGQGK